VESSILPPPPLVIVVVLSVLSSSCADPEPTTRDTSDRQPSDDNNASDDMAASDDLPSALPSRLSEPRLESRPADWLGLRNQLVRFFIRSICCRRTLSKRDKLVDRQKRFAGDSSVVGL
jgi:hypothetical protein